MQPVPNAPELSDVSLPAAEPPQRRRRRSITADERHAVLQRLAIRPGEGWWFRFSALFGLSVLIAATGLSQGSPAVVIGAMLVAPLMTPIMALSAGLAVGSHVLVVRAIRVVVLASIGAVAFSWLLAGVWPGDLITGEVLARTSPDIRDLLVALAAGAAGAYATIHADISNSLPGAGVAVALVPPLAVVGITLRAGRGDLARGAVLLYSTNVAAIALASAAVFALTGFAPPRLRQVRRRPILGGTFAALALAGVLAVPLAVSTNRAVRSAQTLSRVNQAVVRWLDGSDLELVRARVDGSVVTIDVVGSASPPSSEALERSLSGILGGPATVKTRWTQRSTPEGRQGENDAVAVEKVSPLVDAWLAGDPSGADAFDVRSITVAPGAVTIEITSIEPPPPASELADLVRDELGAVVSVDVLWSEARPEVVATEQELRAATGQWVARHPGLSLMELVVDDERGTVTVDLLGPTEPGDVDVLASEVKRAYPDLRLVVRFVERRQLSPATTTAPVSTSSSSTTALLQPVPTSPSPTPVPTVAAEQSRPPESETVARVPAAAATPPT